MARISRENLHMLFEYGVDISTKTLYMGYGDPDSEVELDHILASHVIKGLHILSNIRKEEPINLFINNQGGDTQHGLAIYDCIRLIESPVHITVAGHCYSMAAWVLQAGDIRRMTENSSIMIHDGNGTKNAFTREQDSKCRDILLARVREKIPTYSAAALQKLLDKDTFMWADRALELGLIDEIV